MAVEEVESWLASDSGAVAQVLGKMDFADRLPARECQDPKEWLKTIYKRHAKREYIGVVENPRLAKYIDVATVAKNNSSFKDFCDYLR